MASEGNPYHLGIDLGTTYVAAGILEQGRPEIITLGDRSAVLPSVLYFREDGDVLTGEAAIRRGLGDPTRMVREFKRRVGDTTPVVVGQTPYSVDVLMSKLLRHVYDAVVARQGRPPASLAITHPANWGPYKIDVLTQAVRLAELGVDSDAISTLTEPVAAAIHFAAAERLDPGQTVAVYDLGGGTFDAAVLSKTADGFTVLGEVEGVERLGGIDFDEAVFQHVVRFTEEALAELDVDDPASIQALTRLRQECVDAKEVLSADVDVTIPVVLPNFQREVRLTRTEFEAMIRPLLQQTVEALQRAIRSAGVEAQDLAAVLLVGGSSRIPLIAEMVGAELGRPIAVDRHPKHTVALGAAISAGRAEETAPQVDDWFRSDPTGTLPTADGAAAGGPGAAAGAGDSAAKAGAAKAGDDPFSMFAPAGEAPAGPPSVPVVPDQGPSANVSSTTPASTAPASSKDAASTENTASGDASTAPTVPEQAAHHPPAAPPVTSKTTKISNPEDLGRSQSDIAIGPPPGPANRGSAIPSGSIGQPIGQAADSSPPRSGSHPLPAPRGDSGGRGGRALALIGAALILVLAAAGGVWALSQQSPDNEGGDADAIAATEDEVGVQDGNGGEDGNASTLGTDPNPPSTEDNGTTQTTNSTATTSTTSTTETTETTDTTAPPPLDIRIVSGPAVNQRGETSFQFNYVTNDVCGTGSFVVREQSTGNTVGSFTGNNVCAGPQHGGFPNGGSPTFAGFDLEPGTTYTVRVTVRGTASDGDRRAGQGTDSATFSVTTRGTAPTTGTTSSTTVTDTTVTSSTETSTTTSTTGAPLTTSTSAPDEEAGGPIVTGLDLSTVVAPPLDLPPIGPGITRP